MCEVDLDGECCEVWVNTWHTARKQKRCLCCHLTVQPGERYMRHFNLFDGVPSVEFLCSVCGQAAEDFHSAHHWSPQTPAGIRYMLQDCIENGDEQSRAVWSPRLAQLDSRRKESGKV